MLVQGVEGDVNAIGYFGYAYYLENADRLKILNVNGVEPNETTAESSEYPLARPLLPRRQSDLICYSSEWPH